jgi:large repetitive protein
MFIVMQRDSIFRLFFLLAIYISTVPAYGQGQTDQNWYFGNTSNAIQFSRPGDTARLVTRPVAGIATYGNAGGAVASDPYTGGLLFYTDGNTVYDATHRPMPNGLGLGGNSAGNQPAVIVEIPGQSDRYYIITNDATATTSGSLRFSEVDMTLPGNNSVNPTPGAPPLGDVGPVKATALAGLTAEAEAMIIIPHDNGTDFWLITQIAGTGDFHVSAITAAGITPAAAPTAGGSGLTFTAAHFAYHAATGKLAVAPAEVNKNVMIFDFNSATGGLSFNPTTGFVFNSAVTGAATAPAIYDVEWSNSGNYLYVSRQGTAGSAGDLIQYDLLSTTITPASILPQAIARSYGLQMAPDSSIYHLYQATSGGAFLVGRIVDPDSVSTLVNYERLPFGSVNFNATQFPSFAYTSTDITLDFSVSGTCANSPSTFFPQVDPGADSLVWDFGDGAGGSNAWSPTYTYTQGGTFPVTLKAYAGGDSTILTKDVTITQFDLQIQLVTDTTACSCELKFPKADPPPPPCNPFTLTATATGATGAIQWFGPSGALAGQTSLTLSSVDSAGFYYVVVQDPNGSGCAAYAGVNIKEYGVDDPRSNIWYFGNNGGINFNADFNPATGADAIEGDLISAEGTAVMCDRNGQVILSTNGEVVFDREGNALSPVLGGSQNSAQSALIIPFPGDPTLYYIFVTQEVYPASGTGYELRYAIFDLKQAPFGQLVVPAGATEAGTVLFTKSTERITGNENWLIAHEYGNNNFRAYRLTATGISAPVISSIGSDHSLAVAENGQGYMKLSPNNIIAVALSTPGTSNVVEIFDFVDSTGAVLNFRTVDLQQPAGQVYGIEFSPSGGKLFASTIGAGSSLHEFAYDSASGTYIRMPTIPVVAAPQEIGALQRGPDGTIYVATNGSTSLGTINANEDKDTPSTFEPAGFALKSGTSSTLGLPNFIQNIADPTQTPSISADGLCFGSPTLLMGSGTDPIDTLTWFFGDGSSQKGVNLTEVEHTYNSPGTYIVTLRLSNRCVGLISPDLTDTVTISPIPNALSGVISLCDGGDDERMIAISDDQATPDLIYGWSHGDSTRNPIPPDDGNYVVTVTNGAGCAAEGEWEVFDNRPQVELGPDQTICENTPAITLNAGNPGSVYTWRKNGTALSTAQSIQVKTTPPTSAAGDEYLVIVRDTFTTCVIRDSITFVINPDAKFSTASQDPTMCGAADGEIDINIQATGTFSYTVNGPSTSTFADATGPGGPFNVPGLRAGAYNVMVANQITGCFDQRTVGLSDTDDFEALITRAQNCNDADGRIPVNISTDPPQPDYTFRIVANATTNQVAAGDETTANPVARLTNGSYAVEVTAPPGAAGCVVVSEITQIRQDDPVVIESSQVVDCGDPSISVVAAAGSFLWQGMFIPAGEEVTNKINPDPPAGTTGQFSYDLHLEPPVGAAACPMDTTFTLNIGLDPPASISQSDWCQDDVILSAEPTGSYTYLWERNSTSFTGGQQVQIAAPDDNGQTYKVFARNTNTGCIVESDEFVAVALGLLTVDISNAQPCEGQDFELEATTSQDPDTYIWELNDEVLAGENGPVLSVMDDLEGLFKITVRKTASGKSCQAADSVQINIAPVTAGVLVDNGIICPDPANPDPNTREVVLDPGSGFISYNWFRDGVELGVTDPTLTATEIGTYSVDLMNSFGCASSDRITLIEECDPKIVGPNAFRPGGLNKDFYLFTFFIADDPFEIFIFNRWGEMVFHSSDRNFRWNGGYNNQSGQELPPGTYSYLVKFKSSYRPEQGVMEYRGGVVLLK